MDIHRIVELSGLSRDQINQLISRYGVHVWGRNRLGGARYFTSADAFQFYLAGELYRAGMSMVGIRGVLAGLPLPRLTSSGTPWDYLGFAADVEKDFLALRLNSEEIWEGRVFPSLDTLDVWLSTPLTLIFSLEEATRRIRAAEA